MASWYYYSVLALLLLGCQRFLYKLTAERGYSSGLTSAVFMATVALLSGAVFVLGDAEVLHWPALLLLSLANSAAFALATVANIEALRYLPAAITFPLSRLSLILVVVVSVWFFEEQLSFTQWFGILLGGGVVAIMAIDIGGGARTARYNRSGFVFIGACVVCGAIAAISSKLAAVMTNKAAFMMLSYVLGTTFVLGIEKRWRKNRKLADVRGALVTGVSMGVLNFFGFYAFLTALESGPLSAIALITGMHFIVAITLSVLIYRERLTPHRCVGIILTVLAVVMLRG